MPSSVLSVSFALRDKGKYFFLTLAEMIFPCAFDVGIYSPFPRETQRVTELKYFYSSKRIKHYYLLFKDISKMDQTDSSSESVCTRVNVSGYCPLLPGGFH